MLRWIINILLGCLIAVVCFHFGKTITLAEQLPLFGSLRDTSSIIFTVMGIWIAVLFPDALQRLSPKSKEQAPKAANYDSIRRMISPMIFSTVVIAVVLLLNIMVPVLKQIDQLRPHILLLRRISFAVLGLLAFFQIKSLLETFVPQDIILSGVDRLEQRTKAVRRFFNGIKD